VPGTIDDALDKLARDYGIVVPLADLMYKDLYERVVARASAGQYLGLGTVNDLSCHHLAFSTDTANWEVWIEAGDKRLDWKLDYDPSLPDVWADRDQMVQIVLNLARNAVQAMREGDTPRPRLTFRTRVLRQFTIHGKRHRLAVRVDVEDNGPGVPESLVETLFLPMVSGRPGGSGLGLSLAQTIAERHQGMIEFVPMRRVTRFSLILPIHPDGGSPSGRTVSDSRKRVTTPCKP